MAPRRQKFKAAIYLIRNKINQRIYVGSAVDYQRRRNEHKKLLNSGKHPNRFLLNDFKKFNLPFEQVFSFKIKEFVLDKRKLLDREQYYLNILYDNQNMCYNLAPHAKSTLGVKWTKDAKKKHSEKRKGSLNPMWGKAHSLKTKKSMAKQQSKRVRQFSVNGALIAEYSSISKAAKAVGLSRQMIGLCCNRQRKTGKGFIWRFYNEET